MCQQNTRLVFGQADFVTKKKLWIFSRKLRIIQVRGENMIVTTAILMDNLKEYKARSNKIARKVENKEIFPIVRGLYETNPDTSGHLLAASIYAPSYLSFDYARPTITSYLRLCTITHLPLMARRKKRFTPIILAPTFFVMFQKKLTQLVFV